MESVINTAHEIHFGELAKAALQQYLNQNQYSKIFLLVDENTNKHCLGPFSKIYTDQTERPIVIKTGEINKTISTCVDVWDALSNLGGDRKSILLNLGGGVVTDLGGFVASTFKRGIDFINVPTTLLAMVDASVGGKTGVDLGVLKNQVGVINQPKMVLIFPEFLETLEERQLKSGYAEMLKHGLIADKHYWNKLVQLNESDYKSHIQESILIKNGVVEQDPTEQGVRKKLNFGHTLGHAIESYFLEHPDKKTLLHGEAIAIGMILEGYLSHQLTGMSRIELEEIKKVFLNNYDKVSFTQEDINIIIDLLKHDKKNSHGNINFVLLEEIGSAITDVKVPFNLFKEAFAYYIE
ncbi:3-dehydroquinate synthase [Croceitalea rosinachiae]|uniref:3-dehydroquinate synthase n=1 Tax=Croceitalea rosinachiae TaxID=3075596 RepID=A0ABU3AC58_9FLAO|nr:3-dehydroquinate synthase [Croceitalea sp. F388]MDT0607473.1 3-dehydroquinate synthase [Croceitalea sp. F388]